MTGPVSNMFGCLSSIMNIKKIRYLYYTKILSREEQLCNNSLETLLTNILDELE